MLLITCAFGKFQERTQPLIGETPLFLIVTSALKPLLQEFNAYPLMAHDITDETVTVTFVVPELGACVVSPLYVPVSVLFVTDEVKVTLHVPVPPESVIVQFVSAPVMATVPVGVVEPPVTVAVMGTNPLDGVPAVITVEVPPTVMVCDALLVFLLPVYVAVILCGPGARVTVDVQLHEVPDRVAVQSVVEPFLTTTVPVAVPPTGVTTPEKVGCWPVKEAGDVIVVVVSLRLSTVWFMVALGLLALCKVSPP